MSAATKMSLALWFLFGGGTWLIGSALYFLWAGKANCWPGQSTNPASAWWILREEQPFAFWFRVVLFVMVGLMMFGLGSLPFVVKNRHAPGAPAAESARRNDSQHSALTARNSPTG